MTKSRFSFLYSPYPKALLVPFIALVLFFSMMLFVILSLGLQFTGFTVIGESYYSYADTLMYAWIVSSIIGVILSLYYLGKLQKHFLKEKPMEKKRKSKKEEMGVLNLLGVFFVGTPFGIYIASFLFSPNGFTAQQAVLGIAGTAVLSVLVWFFTAKKGK